MSILPECSIELKVKGVLFWKSRVKITYSFIPNDEQLQKNTTAVLIPAGGST